MLRKPWRGANSWERVCPSPNFLMGKTKQMTKNKTSGALLGLIVLGILTVAATAGDGITFRLVRAVEADCLHENASGAVTISAFEAAQMHVELFNLPPNTEFAVFRIEHSRTPVGLGWYQGSIVTDGSGSGAGDFSGVLKEDSSLLTNAPLQLDQLGVWFADPNGAVKNGCAGTVTPFDGDHHAGIQVLSTGNFPDGAGPLLREK